MAKNRSVLDVIQQILPCIPEEEEGIRKELIHYMENLWNQAPEVVTEVYYWGPLYLIINKYIKNTDTKWKEDVINIYMDKV